MNRKRSIIPAFIFLILIFIFHTPAYCNKAIMLSDAELDNVYVGGFDFDINLAYAFRAAVINQSNISAVTCIESNKNNITINALNQALVRNGGNSAISNQNNISTVFAKTGDITNAAINNRNIADVANIVTAEGGAKLVSSVSPASADTSAPAAVGSPSLNSASSDATSDAAASNTQAASSSVSVETPVATPQASEILANGSAVVAQTNIAAVVALEGNVINANIANSNVANVQNQGNSAVAAQTNIAIVIAKGNIENTQITNSNVASGTNVNTVDTSMVNSASSVIPLSLGAMIKFSVNNMIANNEAKAAQVNITFVKSLIGDIKNKLVQDLQLNKFVNIR